MRVIQHRQYKKPKPKKTKSRFLITLGFIFILGVTSILTWNHISKKNLGIADVLGQDAIRDKRANAPDNQEYRYFAVPEFQDLYSKFRYPNTQMLAQPPKITGDSSADNRIRVIASSRGAVLHAVPVASIMKVPDVTSTSGLLQEKALSSWTDLQSSARQENIPLSFGSGYRSIELQREMFQAKLKASNLSTAQIASGTADNQLVAILKTTTIPGYSRHHTGYTVDLVCNGFVNFKTSPCYAWLSKDNYLNAKKHGWIPGFPDGASDNSPEPEPAEFEWVGKQAVLNQ